MTARWHQVTRLFESAISRSPADRAAFLRQACRDDSDLRREVESLLAEEQNPALLDVPIAAAAHALLGDNPALMTGTIGVFRIDALLGVGGMGEVYRARDTKLNRDVAIKILPPAFANDPERLARFKREAQVLASLNHPNIGGIHGFEDSGAVHALVLELVAGPTLADRIAHGPVPLDEALAIARQIADALEAAHEQGIIHRDLKPANIKVRDDGTVKVLDFGLAKIAEGGRPGGEHLTQSPTITTPAMTAAGIILGTAAYMSPEQAKGKPADKRSDIWAFGCVLYEMLTARRAFDGEDVADTVASILRAEPDWSTLPAATPETVRALLKGCLNKDRRRRIGHMSTALFTLGDLSQIDLRRSADGGSGKPEGVAQRSRSVPWISTGAALAAGVLAWLGFASQRKSAMAITAPVHLVFNRPAGTALTNGGRQVIAVAPDGSAVAFVSNEQLFLRSLSSPDATPVAGTQNANPTEPLFSPDGRWLAFRAGSTLRKIPTSGGAAVTIASVDEQPFGSSWEADGSILFATSSAVFRVSASGGRPEKILTANPGETIYGPQLLPDGDHILFTATNATGPERWEMAHIVAQSLSTGVRTVLVDGGSDGRYLATGHLLYAVASNLYAIGMDARTLRTFGTPAVMVKSVRRSGPRGANTPAAHAGVSRNGTLAYFPADEKGAFINAWLDPDSHATAEIGGMTTLSSFVRFHRVSPDGHLIVSEWDDENSLWISTPDGSASPRRLPVVGESAAPIWTRDGRSIVFNGQRASGPAIYRIAADGLDAEQRLLDVDGFPIGWSPDGSTLFYLEAVRRPARRGLWAWQRGSAPRPLVQDQDVRSASVSPDGRWLAYHLMRGTRATTFIQAVDHPGQTQVGGDGNHSPLWAPDGKRLYYVMQGTNQLMSIDVQTTPSAVVLGQTHAISPAIFQITAMPYRNYDVAPDGRLLVQLADRTNVRSQQIDVVLNWFEELKKLVPGAGS